MSLEQTITLLEKYEKELKFAQDALVACNTLRNIESSVKAAKVELDKVTSQTSSRRADLDKLDAEIESKKSDILAKIEAAKSEADSIIDNANDHAGRIKDAAEKDRLAVIEKHQGKIDSLISRIDDLSVIKDSLSSEVAQLTKQRDEKEKALAESREKLQKLLG